MQKQNTETSIKHEKENIHSPDSHMDNQLRGADQQSVNNETFTMPKFIRTFTNEQISKEINENVTEVLGQWFTFTLFDYYMLNCTKKLAMYQGLNNTLLKPEEQNRFRKNFVAFILRMVEQLSDLNNFEEDDTQLLDDQFDSLHNDSDDDEKLIQAQSKFDNLA